MTAPDSGLPRRLHDIWTDLLGDSDPDAGFLEAGGHSVLAARLIARIGAELDATLSLATLIRDNPSFHDLVAFVERARHDPSPAGPRPAAPESTADNHPEPAPISPAMRRIWTWHQLHPDSPAYNVVRVLTLDAQVQPATLRAALADLADRHDALRCRVVEPAPARAEIVIDEAVSVPLVIDVVHGTSHDDVADQVDTALRRTADRPIPLDTAPLWRCGLVWSPATGRTWIALVMHHLISDLRSSDIVLNDLAIAYAARQDGAAPQWPRPAPGLLPHLRRQAGHADSAQWKADLDWWGQRLAARARTPLPGPAPLAAGPDEHRATTHTVDLPARAGHAVDSMVRGAGITPAVFFLTIATTILASRSGGDPGVVGVPSLRVAEPSDEQTVSFLLDTLLLDPGDPAADKRTVVEACAATRLTLLDAVDHATPTYDEILDRLQLPRTSRSPLIRLWFNDLTGAAPPARFANHASTEHDLAPGWALFDLSLYVIRTADGYRLHLAAPQRSAHHDVADLTDLAEQVARVCSAAAADPQRQLVGLLPPARNGGHSTTPPAPGHAPSTVELLTRTAGEQPTAPALDTDDGVVDRRTLDHAVTARAAQVLATAEAGDLVALPARRDRLFIERLLACLRAKVTPVLIDAAWPKARRDAAALGSRASHAFPDDDGPLQALPAPPRQAHDLPAPAHVLFTSGTTADPLPVLIPTPVTDAAIADLAAWLGVGSDDRIALLSGPAHDPALRDIGLAVRTGACLCLPAPSEQADLTRLAQWLHTQRISVLSATPTLLTLAFGSAQGTQRLPHLRLVICGGAPLTTATAALIRSRAPKAVIINGYGCVETPQLVVTHRLDPDDPLPDTSHVPIGRPLPGRRVELLTTDGRRCTDGERGELWVGEPWIASGYLTDAPERFVTGSRRLVRTGDLAQRDSTGLLHLVGRLDRQVLVNSHRVLLDEVEAAARGCPGVADAVAELVGDEDHQALRLWVQPLAAESRPQEAAVRTHLTEVLAAPALPATITFVDRLDLSANLKPAAPGAGAHTAPSPGSSTSLDARLQDTAAAVLGHPVSTTTNFFDAGFTSITLLQFGAELSTVLGRRVEPLWLFQHPNLRALAAALGLTAHPLTGADGARHGTPPPHNPSGPGHQESRERLRDARRRARQQTRTSTDQ
ncbi:AMP-binding protein [Streptomyces sp. NBC_00353]|uniref:condensation domain-containing protein n=1 Tax=Streptomyces sp. NBC_00353 TaxID=2975722 RepID=UPI002E27611D